jgi:hypothetical protein
MGCKSNTFGVKTQVFPSKAGRREEGIRTLDTVSRIAAFQATPFNHSGTSLYKYLTIRTFCPSTMQPLWLVLRFAQYRHFGLYFASLNLGTAL